MLHSLPLVSSFRSYLKVPRSFQKIKSPPPKSSKPKGLPKFLGIDIPFTTIKQEQKNLKAPDCEETFSEVNFAETACENLDFVKE